MAPKKLASGQTYEELSEEEQVEFLRIFTGPINKEMMVVKPAELFIPKKYLVVDEKVYNFKFRSDDVVIMTYSKCGTTWMQEIVWTMRNNPDLDHPEAGIPLFARSPFLESDMLFAGLHDDSQDEMSIGLLKKFQQLCPDKDPDDGLQVQMCAAMPSNRTIKTHFPFSMLNPDLLNTAKVIYVARNPKDACLSFLHHHRLLTAHNFIGTQDEFVDHFVKDRIMYGSYATLVKEAWAKKDHPNMHFVFFEDLKKDIDGELKKINDFIGAGLTEKQLQNVKEHTSFSSMKAKDPLKTSAFTNFEVAKKDGGFIRKGQAGGWRGKLTEEQNKKIDDYMAKNFAGVDIEFQY